jgi:N-acyl homoserine lactone hydrolase
MLNEPFYIRWRMASFSGEGELLMSQIISGHHPLRRTLPGLAVALGLGGALVSLGCSASHHASHRSMLGVARSTSDLAAVIDQPGVVELETVTSAKWAVAREKLINLDNPIAKQAGLKKGLEPIEVDFHVLRHPTRGLFLVDTGAERALRDRPGQAAVRGFVASYLHFGTMKVVAPLGDFIAAHENEGPVRGVFLTHLHPDHISGMVDVPASAIVYTGPDELSTHLGHNLFLRSTNDRALAGKPPVEEWPFRPDPAGRFDGVIDVFGDGQVWALWVPGHTHGSTAFVVRTPRGPVLLTGDASHTRWGWDHGVEPGSLSDEVAASRLSLERLRSLAAEHPRLDVRPGHQR